MSVRRNRFATMAAAVAGLTLAGTLSALSPSSAVATDPAGDGAGPGREATVQRAPTAVVKRISLSSGPLGGGGQLMVFGSGLAVLGSDGWTAAPVRFGGAVVPAGDVRAFSDGALLVKVPGATVAGTVTVTVGDAVRGPKYTYLAPQPRVTTSQSDLNRVMPSSETGKADQTIVGTDFSPKARVVVGGVKTTTTATPTTLTFSYPPRLAGVQDVVVVDPREAIFVGYVTYVGLRPTVQVPASGIFEAATEGPTVLALTGTNLNAVTRATFGEEKVGFKKTTDPTTLSVTVPKGAAKIAELTLTTAYGESVAVPVRRAASPTPTVTGVSVAAPDVAGVATITGTGLLNLRSVTITPTGGRPMTVTAFTGVTATAAGVLLPALPAGSYTIVATTLSATPSEAFPFTVAAVPPTVTAASTTNGIIVKLAGAGLSGITEAVFTPVAPSGDPVRVGAENITGAGTSAVVAVVPALKAGDYTVVVTTSVGTSSNPGTVLRVHPGLA